MNDPAVVSRSEATRGNEFSPKANQRTPRLHRGDCRSLIKHGPPPISLQSLRFHRSPAPSRSSQSKTFGFAGGLLFPIPVESHFPARSVAEQMKDKERILRLLAAGEQRTFSDLGLHSGSIAEFISWLEAIGIHFQADDNSLLIPDGLDLLDHQTIGALLPAGVVDHLDTIETHLCIDSTNTYLMTRPSITGQKVLCLAEQQTAGRGRRGRTWVSPFGTNLYMSLHWPMSRAQSLDGLSLAVGVAVTEALSKCGVSGIQLKWPNDLLLDGGKLGGILIELKAPGTRQVEVVIGIGINLRMPEQSARLIDQAWRDLDGQIDKGCRNMIAAQVAASLVRGLDEYARIGFAAFRDAWLSIDAYRNKSVRILQANHQIEGIEQGVDATGALLVSTSAGLQTFHGGEVSLRSGDDS